MILVVAIGVLIAMGSAALGALFWIIIIGLLRRFWRWFFHDPL